MIGHAVDLFLHETIAAVLSFLDRKMDIEQNASTFANRSGMESGLVEDCMSTLYSTQHEKDEFTLFEVSHCRCRVLLVLPSMKFGDCSVTATIRAACSHRRSWR
jgi:hypothetical protein